MLFLDQMVLILQKPVQSMSIIMIVPINILWALFLGFPEDLKVSGSSPGHTKDFKKWYLLLLSLCWS